MTKIIRFELDFEPAFSHFQFSLLDANALSSAVLKFVDFKSGKFFTLLPTNIDPKKINKFRCGGIREGVRELVRTGILDRLSLNAEISCIFDDATSSYNPEYKDPLFLSNGLVHENEIYYLITQRTASQDIVNRCFYASDAIWHSLCIISEINLNNKIKKELSSKEIRDICMKAQLIIIGAYDAEGYVFWEKLGL